MTSRADLPVEKFGLFLPMETRQAVSGAQAGGALLVPIGAATANISATSAASPPAAT